MADRCLALSRVFGSIFEVPTYSKQTLDLPSIEFNIYGNDVEDHTTVRHQNSYTATCLLPTMKTIEYVHFKEVISDEFIALLNKIKVRVHLVNHELFGTESIESWISGKIEMDTCKGCTVRAILVDKHLAGWCGIQLEDSRYEVAIVIDDSYWGLGIKIFREVMVWAKILDHDTVFIHLLDTRPDYKFLRKIAKNVYGSEILGSRFTAYELAV